MIPLPETSFLVVGLSMLGTGVIFLWNDKGNRASRALSLCLIAIGIRLFLSGTNEQYDGGLVNWLTEAFIVTLESAAIYAGIEWGRRIAKTGSNNRSRSTAGLFRGAQLLILIYWALNIGYLTIAPDQAGTDLTGIIRVRGIEFAIFAPILGSSILLVTIAIAILSFSRIDPIEKDRLRALSAAGPFLLAALIFNGDIIPITLTIGLLFFLAGSVRYLVVQSRRGQFMRQFLSPDVAQMVQLEGLDKALLRERRLISVVVCDLRGFTSYARKNSSDQVMNLLEQFYEVVGDVAEAHGGTVKDHAGDGVLILVGAPLSMPDHALRAVRLALDLMAQAQVVINAVTDQLGLGVGLATGNTTVGTIRGAGRLEYVAVGNAVNLAARLCDRAEPGEILSDTRTLDLLPEDAGIPALERPPETLKGFPEPIAVRALGKVAEDAGVFTDQAPDSSGKRRRKSRRSRRRSHSRKSEKA